MATGAITKPAGALSGQAGKRRRSRKGLLGALSIIDVNDPYVALRLKEVFETGKPREKLIAAKFYALLTGDLKDEKTGGGTTNVFQAPVMIIKGASGSRLKALRDGGIIEEEVPVIEQPAIERDTEARTEKG